MAVATDLKIEPGAYRQNVAIYSRGQAVHTKDICVKKRGIFKTLERNEVFSLNQ